MTGGRAWRMYQFLGSHQNKLDAKGRVSVPASFRAMLREGSALSARDIGARDIGARDIGARDIGAREVGAREVGAREAGGRELGRRETEGRQSGEANGTVVHLVLRPSHLHPCIEAWPPSEFATLAAPLEHYSPLSADHEDLAASLYADAYPVESDREGRILIPDQLAAHAGLNEAVVFMGMGSIFQIWEPAAAERRRAEARARARGLAPPGAPRGASRTVSPGPSPWTATP